jgi:hypothetical protein
VKGGQAAGGGGYGPTRVPPQPALRAAQGSEVTELLARAVGVSLSLAEDYDAMINAPHRLHRCVCIYVCVCVCVCVCIDKHTYM